MDPLSQVNVNVHHYILSLKFKKIGQRTHLMLIKQYFLNSCLQYIYILYICKTSFLRKLNSIHMTKVLKEIENKTKQKKPTHVITAIKYKIEEFQHKFNTKRKCN